MNYLNFKQHNRTPFREAIIDEKTKTYAESKSQKLQPVPQQSYTEFKSQDLLPYSQESYGEFQSQRLLPYSNTEHVLKVTQEKLALSRAKVKNNASSGLIF